MILGVKKGEFLMQSLWSFNARFFLSFVLAFNGLVHAEIPFTWIKGLYAVTGTNYQLSAVNGLVWYRQNIVKNMYDIWIRQAEGKKNNTIKLIEEIFYLQRDGVSFLPTKRPDKLATYFTHGDIGQLIASMQIYRKNKNKDEFVMLIGDMSRTPRAQKAVLNEKNTAFKEHPNLLKAIEEIDRFFQEKINVQQVSKDTKIYFKQKFGVEIDKISKNLIPDRLLTLQGMRQQREKVYPELTTVQGTPRKKMIAQMAYDLKLLEIATKVESFDNLVQLLVGSLEESMEGNPNEYYIPYTTEQILLAFLWAKSDTREDFKAFFDALGQDYVNQKALDDWVNKKPEYTTADYVDFRQTFDKTTVKDVMEFIGKEYETAIFAVRAYYMWYQALPFVFAGTTVEYEKDGVIYSFADCGETSLRNFFDIILKNLIAGKFDMSYLLNAKSVDNTIPLKISDKLVGFYDKHFSFDNITSLKLYNDWTYVVEDLPDVNYLEPREQNQRFYEINSGVSNILQVLNNLLFGNNEAFKKLSKKDQLDLICKQLSRDNFTLSWYAVDDKDDSVDVNTHDFLTLKFEIEINKKKVFFEWKFEEKHFILSTQSASYPIATDKVQVIAQYMSNVKQADKISLYTLLGCYANRDNFELICEDVSKALTSDQLVQLIYLFYDVQADWAIWAEQLRDLNRARMILAIAKNAANDTILVNFFISELLRQFSIRSSFDVQMIMTKELLTFNQVHAGSLLFIVDRLPKIINEIDIRTFAGIASLIQKLDMKDKKQKSLLDILVMRIVKDNINTLFSVVIQKINGLDPQDCMNLIVAVTKLKPIIAEQFVLGLIPITSSLPLLEFFIINGKNNKRSEVVRLAQERKDILLERKPIGEKLTSYEYEID